MNWIHIENEQQLATIKELSNNTPQIIFKHSMRCSISSVAKKRLERGSVPDGMPFYFLDLLKFRGISNKIAQEFDVPHQSPQLLIIVKGACVYDASHTGIHLEEIISNAFTA